MLLCRLSLGLCQCLRKRIDMCMYIGIGLLAIVAVITIVLLAKDGLL